MRHQRRAERGYGRLVLAVVAVVAVCLAAGAVVLHERSSDPGGPLPVHLPTTPQSYLGVFASAVPASYAGVTGFAKATGVRPDIVMFYSGWYQPFPGSFAAVAAKHGTVPLVQMDPDGISMSAIAAGHYDGYLSAYAEAVRAYSHPVIISFAHEMNGNWYTWGYQHTSPKVFVAAWRHVVTLFRALGAQNVTWLWTVNIINDTQRGTIPGPDPWWPGSSYVTWVGIDGYYLKPSWQFAPLFGPTIAAVRKLTSDPILIAETGATPAAGKPAKIANLFAGIRDYGLLGFVWFDTINRQHVDFSVDSAAADTAFAQGAKTFTRPTS
jgi:mannan endo-1,4-beta-mannosidase